MPTLTIAPGDTVTRIATAAGFAPDTVWSHPGNDALRTVRDHMDVLAAGDRLFVPDKTAKTLPCATDARHRFRRRGVPMRFVLQLLDLWGEPRRGLPYRLVVDGVTLEGRTDGDGVLRVHLPTSARQGMLHAVDLDLALAFGELEPKGELLGAQQRLTNLGFPCLEDDGRMGRATAIALLRFQRVAALEETCELDAATRAALHDHHGRLDRWRQRLADAGGEA